MANHSKVFNIDDIGFEQLIKSLQTSLFINFKIVYFEKESLKRQFKLQPSFVCVDL